MALRPAATSRPDDEPLGVLVARLGDDLRRIVRAEVALVQVRVEAGVRAARAAAAGLVAAALLALGGFGALLAGLVLLLAAAVPLATWAAAVIVGGALLVVGVVAGVAAAGVLRRGLRAALERVDVEVAEP